ncbi:MAG: SulP family inorganic anion transporter [Polaromonas sp.]
MTLLTALPGLRSILIDGRGLRWADVIAGLITGLVLVPQAVAFAQLAGLPAQVGLAASMLPMVVYALLGSSRTLSVGPVSVAALMVFEVVQRYPNAATTVVPLLAAQAAVFLLLLLLFRLEVVTRVFSHPVLNGFTVAAALLIAWSQLKPLLGSELKIAEGLQGLISLPTVMEGLLAAAGLYSYNQIIGPWLQSGLGGRMGATPALLLSRVGPLLLLAAAATLYAAYASSFAAAWQVVGHVPSSVLQLNAAWIGSVTPVLFWAVLPSAVMVALVGYVESFAVAQSLAQKRRETLNVRTEMLALSAANGAASLCGAMPVAGGFSRSMVNFSAGARTQLASIVAAAFSFTALLLAANVFNYVPKFALAAIIIVAIIPLISFGELRKLWRTDRSEAAVWLCTFAGVLFIGLEQGLLLGAALGLLIYLSRSLAPHTAVMGRLPNTEHYRNVLRHPVETFPGLLLLRFDESLTFLNASSIKDMVQKHSQAAANVSNVVLSGAAINHIDSSGAHTLLEIAQDLKDAGIGFHLAEIKGPVLDYFANSGFKQAFVGKVFLSLQEAVDTLRVVD